MKRQNGVILVELAIALPVFLLIILGGLDLLLLANAKSDLDAIAITTASCSASNVCPDPQIFAQSLAEGFVLQPSALTAVCTQNTCTLRYKWTNVSPWFSPLTLKSEATAPLNQ